MLEIALRNKTMSFFRDLNERYWRRGEISATLQRLDSKHLKALFVVELQANILAAPVSPKLVVSCVKHFAHAFSHLDVIGVF